MKTCFKIEPAHSLPTASWLGGSSVLTVCLLVIATFGSRPARAEIVVDFEELNVYSGTSGTDNEQPGGMYYNGDLGSGTSNTDGWSSQSVTFSNYYSSDFGGFWGGFGYSNVQNSVTAGHLNQYAAAPGGGSDGLGGVDFGGNYAIAYSGGIVDESDAWLHFSNATRVHHLDLANSTYLYRYAVDNAPPFYASRANLQDGEYVRLRIEGLDQAGQTISSSTQTLIDFAGPGTSDDFALADWETVSLENLGIVHGLKFVLESNVTSTFGETTYVDPPAYFALDNLTLTAVPEPSAAAGLALLAATWGTFKWRRRNRPSVRKTAEGRRQDAL